MASSQVFTIDVPEGYPPASKPCDPSTRFPEEQIKIERATEADLPMMAYGLQTTFARAWWVKHRPKSGEPSAEDRKANLITRLRILNNCPEIHSIKATVNGQFAGYAAWHVPSKEIFIPDLLGYNAIREWGFPQKYKWSPEEETKIWSDINIESWEEEFQNYDKARREIMGSEPHWYLAPFFVLNEFQGRGVGKHLLKYASDLADAQSPRTTLYLESLPNARPVYWHMGYEKQEGEGRDSVMIRNDYRKRK